MRYNHDMRIKILFFVLVGSLLSFGVVNAHEESTNGVYYIHMTERGFEPSTVEIQVGETVIFENKDIVPRWPASNIHPTHRAYPGSDIDDCGTSQESYMFDACRSIPPGGTYAFQFNKVGEWRFHEHLMSTLNGIIKVLDDPTITVGSETVSEQDNEETETIIRRLTHAITIAFTKLWYALFPSALEKKLADVKFFDVAKNEEQLTYWLSVIGAKKLMAGLIHESGGGSTLDCHSQAHEIGRQAYTLFGADVYHDGTAACHSGFYHGVMESFIADKGTADFTKNIEGLCGTLDTYFGEFECYHGVGHGIMAYQDYDLPRALEGCKKLSTSFEQNSCYGGVFMENVVAGQGNGAREGHETKWVSRDNPHFPCSTIQDPDMLHQCYQMQTSWMLTLNGFNFDIVARECLNAPPSMVPVCYRSFGRDSAGHYLRDPQKIIDSCKKVPTMNNYYSECIVGGVYVILDFWGPELTTEADELCEKLEGEVKGTCTALVTSRKADLKIGSVPEN